MITSVASNDADDEAVQVNKERDEVKRDLKQVSTNVCLEVDLGVHFDGIINAHISFRDSGLTVDQPPGHRQIQQHDDPVASQNEEHEKGQ